eukprot:2616072-Prymnesium_polylepis.1
MAGHPTSGPAPTTRRHALCAEENLCRASAERQPDHRRECETRERTARAARVSSASAPPSRLALRNDLRIKGTDRLSTRSLRRSERVAPRHLDGSQSKMFCREIPAATVLRLSAAPADVLAPATPHATHARADLLEALCEGIHQSPPAECHPLLSSHTWGRPCQPPVQVPRGHPMAMPWMTISCTPLLTLLPSAHPTVVH